MDINLQMCEKYSSNRSHSSQ